MANPHVKGLGSLPHQHNTWLGYQHTAANGGGETPLRPYAPGIKFCAAALLPSVSLGEAALSLKRRDGETVYFWAVVPLHLDELNYAIAHGMDALTDLFDQLGVTDRIDPARPSVLT